MNKEETTSAKDKQILKESNVLDFNTLNETRIQLEKNGSTKLVTEIVRILTENKIEKPELHNDYNIEQIDNFVIDLGLDQIESIVGMFGDLEVRHLGANYESTHSARMFASLLDKWNELPEYR